LHKISISVHSFEEGDAHSHRRYLEQIAAFAARAAQAGTIVCLRLWNRGFDGGRNDSTLAVLRQLFPQEWAENNRGYRLRDRLFLEWGDRFEWPDLAAPLGPEAVFCHGMKDQFGILCDGSVVPCCLDSEGVITLGNVFSQNLGEVLQSPRAQAMVQGFGCRRASEELCRRCGYAQRFSLDKKIPAP
jgi:radical SAM protein with 4Fe4S-binding SPASM domain